MIFRFSRSTEKPYRDLDALDDYPDSKTRDILSARPTTSYRDLTEDRPSASRPTTSYRDLPDDRSISSPSSLYQLPPEDFATIERKLSEEILEEEEEDDDDDETSNPKETFYNQNIPYPVVNDKRDLEVINRQLKNQLRGLEASKNNPLYDQKSNQVHHERLKKQNEYINLKLRIEKVKRSKAKTQREKEENKKHFHLLLQVCLFESDCFLIMFFFQRNFVNFNVLCD